MLGQAHIVGNNGIPQVSKRPKLSVLLVAVAALSMMATGCLSSTDSPVVGPPSYENPPQEGPSQGSPTQPNDQTPPSTPPAEAKGQVVGSVRYSRSAPPGASQGVDLPLLNATVTVDGHVVAVNKGVFRMDNLSAGRHTVKITSPHFVTHTQQVEVRAGTAVQVRFDMTPRYSWSDLDLLAKLVRSEAGSEPYTGQVAVAATVLTRVLSGIYPNTIPGVVYQKVDGRYIQYEPVLNGTINQPANASAVYAVCDALVGWDPSGGASGFFNPRKTSNKWVRSRPVTTQIGNHVFFL